MEWDTAGESHWLIQLRCGECGCWPDVRVSNAGAAAFDVALDRQIVPITRTLARLDRAHEAAGRDVRGRAAARPRRRR
jgi:hypothetical protein